MSLSEAFRALRERWVVVVAAVLVALVAGAALYQLRPAAYTATLTVYAAPRPTDPATTTPEAAYQGNLLAKERIPSYVQLATSPQVLAQILARGGVDDSLTGLASRITATSTPDSVLINVAIQAPTPAQAVQLAETMAQVLPPAVDQLEQNGPPGSAAVSLRVIRPVPVPDRPTTPGLGLTLGLALLAGLVVGVAIALVRDTLDRSLRTPDDLVAAGGLPVLGTLPAARGDRRTGPGLEPEGSEAGEAYRQLRTALQSAATAGNRHGAPGVLVVVSPDTGDGRTSVVANLAAAAAGSGTAVLTVDADLRRPRLGRLLAVETGTGLTDVLAGGARVDTVTQTSGYGPDVLASGPLPSNPAELLAGGALGDLFEELAERYALVLVDVPPLLPVTDAAVVAAAADGALVLGRRGVTSRDDVATAVRTLEAAGATVLGTALVADPRHRAALPGAGENRRTMTPRPRPARSPVRTVTELPSATPARRPSPTPTPAPSQLPAAGQMPGAGRAPGAGATTAVTPLVPVARERAVPPGERGVARGSHRGADPGRGADPSRSAVGAALPEPRPAPSGPTAVSARHRQPGPTAADGARGDGARGDGGANGHRHDGERSTGHRADGRRPGASQPFGASPPNGAPQPNGASRAGAADRRA